MRAATTPQGMSALLQWLDDDSSDIYVPHVSAPKAAPPADVVPVARHHHVDACTVEAPKLIPDAAGLQQEQPHPVRAAVGVSASTEAVQASDDFERRRWLNVVAESEAEQRLLIAVEALGGLASLVHATWTHATLGAIAEKKKMETIMNNRGLISEDLIKELVEANQAQRNELKQVLTLFQQLSGGGRGGISGGTTTSAASRGRKR